MSDAPKKVARKKVTVTKTKPVKKAPAKKTVARKTVAKKAAPKKTAAKKVAKKTTKKTASSRKGVEASWVTKDKYGFAEGSLLSIAAEEMLKGGIDRKEVLGRIRDRVGAEASSGKERNVSVIMHNALNRLLEQGYTINSSWKVGKKR
jgi:hypothetical protein